MNNILEQLTDEEKIEIKVGDKKFYIIMKEELLNEVVGLVESPYCYLGTFDKEYLDLPNEVLIEVMEKHQRYFTISDESLNLLPKFLIISNISSKNPERIIRGNERVLHARLSDAAFFYAQDKKENLEQGIEHLRDISFITGLGSIYDKAKRFSQLAVWIAKKLNINPVVAERAGWLAKADLTTQMVIEFPELQGVMGKYYAINDGEKEDVAIAIEEHYWPINSSDRIPITEIGKILALSDRIDSLIGCFIMKMKCNGSSDAFGMRRKSIGIIRIIIEGEINICLKDIIKESIEIYKNNNNNEIKVNINKEEITYKTLNFIKDKLINYYKEKNIKSDVIKSVISLELSNLLDMNNRIMEVNKFSHKMEKNS